MNKTDVDALARLLDGDPTLNGEVTAETRALGQIAHVLATQPIYPRPQPRPEFKAELRATLVDAARSQTPAPSALTRLREGVQTVTARWRYSARMAAATGITALALSGGGFAVAADRALPNDMLYPAKLVLEEVRIALVRDEVARGEAHLAQASSRIAEAASVVAAGDDAGAARALVLADEAARVGAGELIRAYQQGGDGRYVERLVEFTDEEGSRVRRLDDQLAGEAADAARALAIGLERIAARTATVAGTCPECAGEAPVIREGADLSVIPPADEPFEACPCELAPTRGVPAAPGEPEPQRQPGPPTSATAPGTLPAPELPAPAPGEPPLEPPAMEVPAQQPEVSPPTPGGEQPSLPVPALPEMRESLSNDDSIVDKVIRDVLDLLR